MIFVPNTNTLICDNIIEKEKKRKTDKGFETYKVKERCGYVNIVKAEYLDYLNYLFKGVPNNQAVIDNMEVE